MTFSDRMKEIWDQGFAASKDFAIKAGGKAQELGERGILTIEIKQLEGQAQKLINRLGNEVYAAFAEHDQKTVSSDDSPIKGILTEISLIKESIEQKEAEILAKKK